MSSPKTNMSLSKADSIKDLKALALAKQWARAQKRTKSIANKG